jgi:DNA repair exonuclease SbcCD ATPase subunit
VRRLSSEVEGLRKKLERLRERKKEDEVIDAEYERLINRVSELVNEIEHTIKESLFLMDEKDRLMLEIHQLYIEQYRPYVEHQDREVRRAVFRNMKRAGQDLDETLRTEVQKRDTLKETNKALELRYQELKSEMESLRKKDIEASELQAEHSHTNHATRQFGEDINPVLQGNECLKQTEELFMSEIEVLQDELKSLRERDKENEELRTELHNMDLNMSELEKKLGSAYRERVSMNVAKDRMHSQIQELEVVVETLRQKDKDSEALRAEYESKKVALEKLEEDLIKEVQERDSVNEAKERLEKVHTLKDEVDSLF